MPADTVNVYRPGRFGNPWPVRETMAQQGLSRPKRSGSWPVDSAHESPTHLTTPPIPAAWVGRPKSVSAP
jgi:hypothetical protein